MPAASIDIPLERLAEFCRRYEVREMSLFGSALRDDFGPDSDLDILVEFDPSAEVGFITLSRMQRELAALLGRRVDLVPKQGLKEKIRRRVLDSAEVIYAA
jgi:predicted nucleotidyltransferase